MFIDSRLAQRTKEEMANKAYHAFEPPVGVWVYQCREIRMKAVFKGRVMGHLYRNIDILRSICSYLCRDDFMHRPRFQGNITDQVACISFNKVKARAICCCKQGKRGHAVAR